MIKVYGAYLANRFFPDKHFEKTTGIVGKSEVVTLGKHCVGDYCELFQYVETDYYKKLLRFNDFSQDGVRVAENITTYEAIGIIEAEKKNLKYGKQLLYFEVYGGKQLELLTGFEFCGYELMDRLCAVSVITDSKHLISKQMDKLNEYGLFGTVEDALAAQKQIRDDNPCEAAADSIIYGVWRCLKAGKK